MWLRCVAVGLVVTSLLPSLTLAEPIKFGARVSGLGAMVVSEDQLDLLFYDRPAALVTAHAMVIPLPWFEAHVGGLGGLFWASKNKKLGGLASPLLGFTLRLPSHQLSPFVMVESGPAFTGDDVRAMIRAGVGIDIGIRRGVSIGPMFGYAQIFQKKRTEVDDNNFIVEYPASARFLWAGITLSYRPLPAPKRKQEVRTILHETHHTEVVREPPIVSHTSDSELAFLLESALPSPAVRTELLAPVLFSFNSDKLEPISVAMLHEVSRLLTQRTDLELVAIEAYADSRGSESYNLELAQRRAQRVYTWLVTHGIEPARLTIAAQGAKDFVEEGPDEEAHEQNRRVIFRVLRETTP